MSISAEQVFFIGSHMCSCGACMDWAVSKGVMKGKGGNILDPKANVTRAEGAQMLKNFFAPDSNQQNSPSVNVLIAVAEAEIGYKEKKSNANLDDKTANAGSKNYTKYARDFDESYPNWYNGKKNGYAWCDMFVDWCFLQAFGYDKALDLLCQPENSVGAGCTYSMKYYKNKGQFYTSNPKQGDQIFFGTSKDNSSHTGIVAEVDDTYVYTIEGNTSDQVARRKYKLSDKSILGYGRPAF